MPTVEYAPGEIARIGKELYERQIRAKVETEENIGKILVLDIETGDYEVDVDHLTAIHRIRVKHPEGAFYSLRIGYPALGRIGGTWGAIKR